jgi:tetratricopeptide (TPR) repeat protein
MILGKSLILSSALLLSIPASAAVLVLGSDSARLCYESARASSGVRNLPLCDEALSQEALSPHDRVATFVNRGIIRMKSGNIDAAIKDFDTAIALDANQPEAYLNKGAAILRGTNGWGDAVPLFSTAIEKRTIRPEVAYLGRGMANESSGNIKAAYLDYKQAAALAPHWKEPLDELSRFKVSRQ